MWLAVLRPRIVCSSAPSWSYTKTLYSQFYISITHIGRPSHHELKLTKISEMRCPGLMCSKGPGGGAECLDLSIRVAIIFFSRPCLRVEHHASAVNLNSTIHQQSTVFTNPHSATMSSLAERFTYKPTEYVTIAPAQDVYVGASHVMSAIIILPSEVDDSKPSLQGRLRLWRVREDGHHVLETEHLKVAESDDSFTDGEVVQEDGRYKVKFAWNCRITSTGTYYFGVTFQGFLPDEEYVAEVEEKTDRFYCIPSTPPNAAEN